ncbi:sterol carrier protein [Desulfofundulus thermobenzoicus]|uniref:Sterol carrier protein n=1 Tax=Desulfofundulus thermobenzoicus TaxID=29376 RepID=A0A6N7IMH2_9FIRM|nr:SCP2 sterol-binding domain-containing protein [Desulfofundulus thermobenzoicus]MQL51114.1 sterol carrier protein [Desulfofundulus thermobenzoicus]HHW44706.1 SCP2 sterol-binding domain-containing protein [Desulfotomaculum sp.]
MASHAEITASLQAFQEGYNKNERLKTMNRDWNRVVLVKATDITSEHTLQLKDGELSVREGAPEKPDLTVISDSETLADLFYGDITPTEPYMNGTLKILGSEDDIVRLDFISLMIWGE